MDYIILYLLILIIPMLAQININSNYNKYKQVKNKKGLTGFEVAREILDKNGLKNMYVIETSGVLTDHYDPSNKVIRLSSDIFHGTSIAAASVAAHECGHAIQDKENYSWYQLRARLVPVVNFITYSAYIFFFISVLLQIFSLVGLSIVMVIASLLFQIVTLPVEFDASKRGLEKLEECDLLDDNEHDGALKVLKAAAMTYVASVLSSILNLIRLIMLYSRKD